MSPETISDHPQPASLAQNLPVPKYYQIREILREQIASWPAGKPIPSEAELCQTYGVSRTTARKALDDLTHEGLLYRVQGKGTFVVVPKLRERFLQRTVGFYEDMASRGLVLTTRVLEQGVVPADKIVAEHLRLTAGDEVIKLVRLRMIGDEPIMIVTNYLPHSLFAGLEHDDLENASLYALMRHKYGVTLSHGTRLVEAIRCTEEEARLLQVPASTPLLAITSTIYDPQDRPVEFGLSHHRGDRAQLEINVVAE